MKVQGVCFWLAGFALAALAWTGCDSSPACPAGQTKCGQGCVNIDADRNNCGACGTVCTDGQLCTDGTCLACQDACAADQRECTDGSHYRECVVDQDTCLAWGDPVACEGDLVCDGDGACVVGCQDQCQVEGEAVRDENTEAYRQCGDFDVDSCLEFSAVLPCDADETCSGGACSPNCSDECAGGDMIFATSRGTTGNFYLYDDMGNPMLAGPSYLGDGTSSVTVTADGGFMVVAQGFVFAYGPHRTWEWYGYLGSVDPTDWIVASPTAGPSGIGTGIVYAVSRGGVVNAFHGAAEVFSGPGSHPKFRGGLGNQGARMP